MKEMNARLEERDADHQRLHATIAENANEILQLRKLVREQEAKNLESSLNAQRLEEEAEKMEGVISSLESERDELSGEVEKLEDQISELSNQVDEERVSWHYHFDEH
jgi:chromosome segregation ATPase